MRTYGVYCTVKLPTLREKSVFDLLAVSAAAAAVARVLGASTAAHNGRHWLSIWREGTPTHLWHKVAVACHTAGYTMRRLRLHGSGQI